MRASPRLPDERVNLPQTHPLRNAAELLLGVGLLGAFAWLLIVAFVDIAVALIPYRVEAEFTAKLFPADAMNARAEDDRSRALERLTTELAGAWPDNPYAFRVRILESEEPNAFAAPGGLILVTEGLLDQCESENELAFVLGHEIGHYRNRDQLRGLGSGLLLQMLLAVAGAGGDVTPLTSPAALAQLGAGRKQERQADRFGLRLVARHYGHVSESWKFFEKVEAQDGLGKRIPAFVSTHPGGEGRIEALRGHAQTNGWPLTGPVQPRL